jgi:hypothetical protein
VSYEEEDTCMAESSLGAILDEDVVSLDVRSEFRYGLGFEF